MKEPKEPKMSDVFTLDAAPLGEELEVVGVRFNSAPKDWGLWLEEIGFTEGEPCVILQKAALGGDPIAVRVGVSTFALRLAEASFVEVRRRGA